MRTVQRISAVLLVCLALASQMSTASEGPEAEDPSHWFTSEHATAKLLILGTFHFKDAGLDNYKPEVDVNILSEQRQAELGRILDQLEEFAPTKILIEVKPERQAEFNERFGRYVAGELELESNEVYQVGFRLAKRLGHSRLYAVDASGRRYENLPDSEEYAKEHGQSFPIADEWEERYMAAYRVEDHTKAESTLTEHLLFLNSPEHLRFSHGHYVLSYLALGTDDEYPAADSLTGWWYNRNLRIYSNILRVMESGDRLLLLIGAGHVPIIRHAAESSPEIDLIPLPQVLR